MSATRRGRNRDHSERTRRGDRDPRGERLQKLIAAAGVASRRAAEELIEQGRVRVNGRVVSELGARADPERDRIQVDGRALPRSVRLRYCIVHKPRGFVTTTSDPHARRAVVDLVPSSQGLFPVGRLDLASEGLVLLTNDGELAQRLMHPSFRMPRVYRVSVDGRITGEEMARLAEGVVLDGRITAPCQVEMREQGDARSVIQMTMVEGRRHQIRRMLDQIGHPVRRLQRVAYGPLRLRGLKPGEWRAPVPEEQAALDRIRREPAG